jgi:hypothetical protein
LVAKSSLFVIPAKAGIQCLSAPKSLDSSFRWNDEQEFAAIEYFKFGASGLGRGASAASGKSLTPP